MNLTEFLQARIAEDHEAATIRDRNAPIHESGCYYYEHELDVAWFCDCDESSRVRALAECEAKRAILFLTVHGCGDDYERVQRALALPYASHSDYRQEWAP